VQERPSIGMTAFREPVCALKARCQLTIVAPGVEKALVMMASTSQIAR
jgi:hypothetical protein